MNAFANWAMQGTGPHFGFARTPTVPGNMRALSITGRPIKYKFPGLRPMPPTPARLQTARLQAASCKVASRKTAGDRLPTARLQAPGQIKKRYTSRAPAPPASLIRCILCSPFLAAPYNKSYKVQGRRGAKYPPPSFAPPRTPPLSSRLTSISETSHTPAEVSADLRVDEWLNQKSARQTN